MDKADGTMSECPGRPCPGWGDRRIDRRQAILDAAEQLFLEHGFRAVPLQAVVRRSGGSLATVYELFGNKQGLLRAVVDRNRERGLGDIEQIACSSQPPAVILRTVAERLHAFATSPRNIDFMRLVIAESLCDPAFGHGFHDDMHRCHIDGLANCFRRWTEEGKAAIDNPVAAAELYIATVLCNAPVKAMLGEPPEPTDAAALAWRLQPFLDRFAIA